MEEILSSIKRIIAEEGDSGASSRARRPAAAPARPVVAPVADPIEGDEILELSEPVPDPVPLPVGGKPLSIGAPDVPHAPNRAAAAPAEPILSERVMEATRGPLEALSRMVVKPEVTGSDTLEGMVREMLKPMLREWLDSNLPQIVESMVAREISRITGNS